MEVTRVGVAETEDAAGVGREVLSVGGRSSKGEKRSGDEKRGKSDCVELHVRRCVGCLRRSGRVCSSR